VSTARVLHMTERRVADADRITYLAAVAARRAECAAHGLQSWLFEHEAEPGRFVEFVEGRDRTALDRVLAGPETTVSVWRSVEPA
jgi:hypothetical protein